MAKKFDRERMLTVEVRRLKSALSAIHNRLHADDVNGAHELVECAIEGKTVKQPNLTVADSAKTMDFAAAFNELAERYGARACAIMLVPSATMAGATSIQMCGEVTVCKIVEAQLRGRPSTYMGDHAASHSEAG